MLQAGKGTASTQLPERRGNLHGTAIRTRQKPRFAAWRMFSMPRCHNNWQTLRSYPCVLFSTVHCPAPSPPSATFTSARMPARIASGRSGQAATIAANSGSKSAESDKWDDKRVMGVSLCTVFSVPCELAPPASQAGRRRFESDRPLYPYGTKVCVFRHKSTCPVLPPLLT